MHDGEVEFSLRAWRSLPAKRRANWVLMTGAVLGLAAQVAFYFVAMEFRHVLGPPELGNVLVLHAIFWPIIAGAIVIWAGIADPNLKSHLPWPHADDGPPHTPLPNWGALLTISIFLVAVPLMLWFEYTAGK